MKWRERLRGSGKIVDLIDDIVENDSTMGIVIYTSQVSLFDAPFTIREYSPVYRIRKKEKKERKKKNSVWCLIRYRVKSGTADNSNLSSL